MSDRLTEIRARLDAATTTMPGANERMVWESDRLYRVEDDRDRASQALYRHAPADIAWLLEEVDRLQKRNRQLMEMGFDRFDQSQ